MSRWRGRAGWGFQRLPLCDAHTPAHHHPTPRRKDAIRELDRDLISCYAFMIATYYALIKGEWPEYLRTRKTGKG